LLPAAAHQAAQSLALAKLGLEPLLDLSLRLGEGSWPVAAAPVHTEATLSLPVRQAERREPCIWSSMVDCDDSPKVDCRSGHASNYDLPLYTANPDDFKGTEGLAEVIGVQSRPNNL
jgi:Phosphoribosyltransferase